MKIQNKGPEFLKNQHLRPSRSSYPANSKMRKAQKQKRLLLTILLGTTYTLFVYGLLKYGDAI